MDLSCDERASDSPFIETVWRSHSDDEGAFISMAQPQWGMVVTRYRGKIILTVRGPETRATPAFNLAGADFFGIQFKHGTLMPHLPPNMVMNRQDMHLPQANSKSFWLYGTAWQFPDFDNAETFVNRLVRNGLLIQDAAVGAVLQGQSVALSLRTVQRRFLQATGLTQAAIYQIQRARQATALLKRGLSILDTVDQAGYADQAHLTRSLKHYIGQTPAQIASTTRTEKLSLLFKTEPALMGYDEVSINTVFRQESRL